MIFQAFSSRFYQPTNQTIHPLTNPSVHLPINTPIIQSTNQTLLSTHLSFNLPTKPSYQHTYHSIYQPNLPINTPIIQSTNQTLLSTHLSFNLPTKPSYQHTYHSIYQQRRNFSVFSLTLNSFVFLVSGTKFKPFPIIDFSGSERGKSSAIVTTL